MLSESITAHHFRTMRENVHQHSQLLALMSLYIPLPSPLPPPTSLSLSLSRTLSSLFRALHKRPSSPDPHYTPHYKHTSIVTTGKLSLSTHASAVHMQAYHPHSPAKAPPLPVTLSAPPFKSDAPQARRMPPMSPALSYNSGGGLFASPGKRTPASPGGGGGHALGGGGGLSAGGGGVAINGGVVINTVNQEVRPYAGGVGAVNQEVRPYAGGHTSAEDVGMRQHTSAVNMCSVCKSRKAGKVNPEARCFTGTRVQILTQNMRC